MTEFYKGFKREQVSQQGAVALQAPSTQVAQESNRVRTQLLTQGIDALVNAGGKVIQSQDQKQQKRMAEKGAIEAGEGKANSASAWTWGGDAQTKAYNNVRGQAAVRDLPSFVDEYFKTNSEKPLDEMSTEERNMKYAEARERFFKDKGLDSASFRAEAAMAATQLQENHLRYMDKQAADLRQVKSERLLQESMGDLVKNSEGDPAMLEEMLANNMDEYSIAVGSSLKAQELMADGLLEAVVSADTAASMSALNYLQSPQAAARFKDMADFPKVVKQAEIFNQKRINEMKAVQEKEAENGFYINLTGGAWGTLDEAKEFIMETPFDPKKKFEMIQLAKRHIETANAADQFQGAINTGQFNIFNAQPKEIKEELFNRNVGGPDEFDLNNITPQKITALSNWTKKGFDVPEWVREIGNAPVGNGEWEADVNIEAGRPPKALNNQLKFYHDMVTQVGSQHIGKFFNSENAAKMEYLTTLTKGVVSKPEEFRQRLDEYDKAAKGSMYAEPRLNMFRRELSEDFAKSLEKFAKEGGSNVFSGPDDLQPLLTFTNMSSRRDSRQSMEYTKDMVSGNYVQYRLAGLDEKEAMQKAQYDFQNQNQWATFNKGPNKHAFIPREFGPDFANNAYRFLENNNAISVLAARHGITESEAEKKVVVQPSSDFRFTRRLSVYFDGQETEMNFDQAEFETGIMQMDQEELERVTREITRRKQDPTYQAREQSVKRFQSALEQLNMLDTNNRRE
jgi:hypothetical protein